MLNLIFKIFGFAGLLWVLQIGCALVIHYGYLINLRMYIQWYSFLRYSDVYCYDDAASSYLMNCIMKLQTINVKIIAHVVVQFMKR